IVTSGTENAGIGALRWKGYQAAITDNGLTLDKNLTAVTNDSFEIKAAYEAVKELLDTAEFTCVFAISDIMAMGAICAISERGLRVPEDISVVGFDGIELGAYYNPPLTTISFPAQKMAEGISEMLMSTLEDKAPTEHRVFKAQLVERRSFCAR
ncbi:MAG: substrate-binding domain-containing protein, partial [Ruthenibacterium sp.]